MFHRRQANLKELAAKQTRRSSPWPSAGSAHQVALPLPGRK